MGFAKSTFLSCLVTGLKLLNGFFLVKLISIYLGPEGLARTGQFISFISFLVLFAGGGINQGIIKYVSEYKEDKQQLKAILGSGQYVMLTSTFISFIAIILFRDPLSILLFDNNDYSYIVVFIAFGQIFMALSNFFTAIINGFKEILKLSLINLLGVITGAIASAILTIQYGFEGILIAYIFSQSFLFVFSLYFCCKIKDFNWSYLVPKFNKKNSVLLAKFSVMSVTAAISANLVQFLIRQYLAYKLSWEQVGYWEGVVKISDAYIILITTALSVYCLPTLSETKDKKGIIDELIKIFKLIIPLTFTLAGSIFLLRDPIINALYSPDFIRMKDLFFWQLVGDIIRVGGMVFAYFLLSKALIKTFVFIEIFCGLTFVGLVYALTDLFGLEGAIYAFLFNSILFLIISFFFSFKELVKFPQTYGDNYVVSPR